jgi:uncharacterized CHY-type Zn-finger protein
MKCWECKKEISKANLLHYYDGYQEKSRDVCDECEKELVFNPCHYVEVNRITQRQLKNKIVRRNNE